MGPRGSIFSLAWIRRAPSFPAGLSHRPTAASVPSRGPGRGWESHVRAGCCGGRAAAQPPLAARELGARGVGESEGVQGVAAPLCCRSWERQGTGDAHACLHPGRREERKGKTSSWKGWGSRTCFGGPNSQERGSCDAQVGACSASDNRAPTFLPSANQPQRAQRCCSPETKGSAFPKPPTTLFLPSPDPGGFGCCRDHSKVP